MHVGTRSHTRRPRKSHHVRRPHTVPHPNRGAIKVGVDGLVSSSMLDLVILAIMAIGIVLSVKAGMIMCQRASLNAGQLPVSMLSKRYRLVMASIFTS